MVDGSVIFEASIDDKKLNQDLEKIQGKVEKLQKAFDDKSNRKGFLESRSKELAAELDREKAILHEMRTASKGAYEKVDISGQSERVRGIQADFNKVNNELDRINEKLPQMEEELEGAKAEAADLTRTIEGRRKGAGIRNALEGAAGSAEEFNTRLKRLVKNALVFTVITKALSAFRDWAKDVILVNADARESFAQLKAALLTLAQPLVSVIVPAFTMLVRVITAVITQVSRLVALITGKSVKSSADAAKALNKQTKALNETGSAAEEAEGSLASFDEINQLSGDTDSSSGGSGVTDFSDIEPDFSYLDEMNERLQNIAKYIMLIAAGFALWKIASHIPGTLGMILTKLAGILVALGGLLLMWDGVKNAWENGLDWGSFLEILAGVAALAGGLALAFGKVGAGIGLVVAGAVMIVTAFHDIIESGANLQNTLLLIAGIVATGLGFSLLTGSTIPLAIAAIAALMVKMLDLTGNLEEFVKNLKENILGGIIDFITGVFSGDFEKAGEGLKKIVKGTVNAFLILVESFINNCIKGLNWLISKINSISFTVPDWVPGIGGKSMGPHVNPVTEIRLPRLASGAVIPPNREFLAVLGDQTSGTNIETPLATMIDAFKQAMAETGGGGTTTVVVTLDGREVARNTVKHVNDMTRQAGKPVLLY